MREYRVISVDRILCHRNGVQDFVYDVHVDSVYELHFIETTPRNFVCTNADSFPADVIRAGMTAVQLEATRHDVRVHEEYLAQQGYLLV